MRRRHPGIPWREMAGTRDRIVHDYFGIRLDVVWTVAYRELPTLLTEIKAILAEQGITP